LQPRFSKWGCITYLQARRAQRRAFMFEDPEADLVSHEPVGERPGDGPSIPASGLIISLDACRPTAADDRDHAVASLMRLA
jgi:hypothetical protein